MRVWNQLHVLALLRVLFLSSTSPSSSSLLCYPFIWNIHWGQMQNCHPAVYLLKQIQSLTRFMNKSLKRQWQWAINWNNEVFLPFLKLYVYDKKYFNGTSLSRMIKNSRGINEKDHHFHIFHVSLKITLTVNCAKKKKSWVWQWCDKWKICGWRWEALLFLNLWQCVGIKKNLFFRQSYLKLFFRSKDKL